MAADYNASLIAELYATEDAEKATRICDEMVSIGDAIFPRQIYEAYKRFKETSVSHYFLSDLTHFKTGDAIEILKEVAKTDPDDSDLSTMVGYLTEIEYFDPEVVERVKTIFEKDIAEGKVYEYDIDVYTEYLKKAGVEVEILESLLRMCFEDNAQNVEARRKALKKLLKLDSQKYIKLYFENYELIKGKKAEIIFVKEISNWHGGIIPSLHQKILETGSETAKEILQQEQLRKTAENKSAAAKEQKEIRTEYQTSDVISDIAQLRSKLNKLAIADNRFGFPLFSASEEIYQQGKPAEDKATLVGYCMVLRSLLGNFSVEIMELEIPEDRAKEIVPDLKDLSGSINKFHFVLLEKGLAVDQGIFGLRIVNRIVSKFAHPGEGNDSELHDLLKKEGLLEYYKEDSWSVLHREILLKYKKVLENLINVFNPK